MLPLKRMGDGVDVANYLGENWWGQSGGISKLGGTGVMRDLAEKLAAKFQFDDTALLDTALHEAAFAYHGHESWKHVEQGTDKLGDVAKELWRAEGALNKAAQLLSGDREFLRIADADDSVLDEIDQLPSMAQLVKRLARLADERHFTEARGGTRLDPGIVAAFKRIEHFWTVETRNELKPYFIDDEEPVAKDKYARLTPANDATKFVCDALMGLDIGVTRSNCKSLLDRHTG